MSTIRKIAELALSPDAHVFRERRGNCGPASMRIVLRDLGKDVPESRLAHLARTDREGTSPKDIVQAARSVGLAARAQEGMTIGRLKSLTEKGTPVIVAYQDGPPTSNNSGHYSVVGAVDKNVHLSDPSSRKEIREVPRSSFLKRWHDVDKSGRPWSHLGITMRKLAEHALQGHTEVQGIPIAIENRKGSVREGTTEDGHHWRTKMKAPYGYIEGTKGKDGEEIDAYVGPDKDAPKAYVVHQHKPDGTGFDEDKVILGVRTKEEAKKLYLEHYDDPKFLGPISTVPIERLKEKIEEGKQIKKLSYVIGSIAGPSGSGKTALLRKLQEKHPDLVAKDTDDFHDAVRVALPAFSHKEYPEEYMDRVRGQLHSFLDENKDRPVLLGGGMSKVMPTVGVPAENRWLLDTGPLVSAWRRYRRKNERPWVGPVGERLGKLTEIPGDYLKNREGIKKIKERGYAPRSPAEIEQEVGKALSMRKLATPIREATKEDLERFKIRDVDLSTSQYGTPHKVKVDVTPEGKFRGLVAAEPETGHLTGLYVSPQHRRQGVATGLIESLEKPPTYLRRMPGNLRAKRFYEALGFEDAGLIDDPKVGKVMTMRKLAAVALKEPGEFAPGIPSDRGTHPIPRVHSEKPETWQMAVQHHEAERAGKHIDFRLVDPQGRAHSWALPKAKLPAPGERVLAVRQPTHSAAYAARRGTFELGEGYGKGRVHGSGLQPVEVVRSQPSQVRFNVYGGAKEGNQEFNLLQTGKGWLLQNISATAERGVPGAGGHPIPHSKPKYSEIPTEKVRFDDAEEIHQAKLDGAHVTYHLRAGKPVKVFSYRPTERATGVLEHTFKLPGWRQLKAPPALAGTVLRGELYATDQGGRALPAEQVGGLLNASVWKSREKQEQLGHLKPAIFDVVRWKGRDVEQAPYSQKLEMLREIQSKMPALHLPRTAVTEQEKRQLFQDIKTGKEPSTAEGIVSWRLGGSRPTKAKFRPDHDAVIVGVTPGAGKHQGRIGALQVRLEGKSAITNVGTGMSDKLRAEIAKNPDAYVGQAVKVHTQQVFPSGKLRAPSFGGFHLEKGKQPWREEKAPDDESTVDQEKTAEPPPPKGISAERWDRILQRGTSKEKKAGKLEPPPKGAGSSLARGLPALLTYKYMTGPYLEKGIHRHKMMMRAVQEGWPAGMAAE